MHALFRSPTGYRLAAAALVLAMPLLSLTAARTKSATFDEPINLMHGLEWLASGDVTGPVDYGPLPRWLAAAAVRLSGVPLRYEAGTIPWGPSIRPRLAQAAMYLDNDADRLLARGRAASIPLQIALLAGVAAWSRRLWGPEGALVSLGLGATWPSLLGHGALVTSDFPVAVLVFLATFALWAVCRRVTPFRLLASGLLLGLGLLSKLSALACLPLFALLLGLRAVRKEPWPVLATEAATRRGRAFTALACLAALSATAFIAVWAFYGFQYGSYTERDPRRAEKVLLIAEMRASSRLENGLEESLLDAAERVRILPEPYLLSLRYTFKHMERRLSFFFGERSITGSVWYFPATIVLKTPLGTLLLAGAVLLAAARRRLPLAPSDALSVLFFPAAFLAWAMTSHIDLGERYILPVYPFALVLAGGAGAFLSSASRLKKAAAWGLIGWSVLASLASYPDHLAYFNELAGGPRGGIRYLGDSNLDWGQDLKSLGPWMRAHGVSHVKLGYFGTALPAYYGLSYEWLPSVGFLNDQKGTRAVKEGDWLAVSATCLQGFYFDDMTTYRFLDGFTPVDHLGHTIYLFHLDREHRR